MARHKDVQWVLPEGEPNPETGGRNHIWDSIQSALLMDIRDELKRLNTLLHCVNFVTIPKKLDAIRRNTEPKKPRRKRK